MLSIVNPWPISIYGHLALEKYDMSGLICTRTMGHIVLIPYAFLALSIGLLPTMGVERKGVN